MIELGKHLENLLLDHNCVIVPNLGGFVAQDCSARYIEEEKIFLPPYRNVAFNPLLQINDGLLAQAYMKTKGLSYPDTLRVIDAAVAELKRSIEEEHGAELSGIGKLKLGANGQYDFIPVSGGIVAPSLYALEVVNPTPIRKDSEERCATIKRKNTSQSDYYVLRIRKTFFHSVVAAIVVFFSFFWAVPLNNHSSMTGVMEARMFENFTGFVVAKQKSACAASASRPSLDTLRVKVSPFPAVKEKTDTVANDNKGNAQTAEANTETIEQAAIQENTPTYLIVLASQVSKKGAKDLIRQLSEKGLHEAVIHRHKNITRVVFGKYSSYRNAYAQLAKLRGSEPAFREAWILKL
ncbi:SPOR domain-containing protein [Alloprevotella sp. OH1205_COT-284]|uniref:HU domain-containing protein n=1 Tax=Alloprevotella sp. OH1205_COT-284 TaxID=2491043 RepID=UPI000F5D5C92|nr:SPOR domain-containing protein [Alloprevotella sp. OH1205_COT-284]RRD80408.1 SPOR domain-containing protein [Alloprevotella sp. OH1205_COT-284]